MRHYTTPDEVRLIEEVERQGGYYRDDTCTAEEVKDLSIPGKDRVMGAGCGEDALFVVPYDPSRPVAVNRPLLEDDTSPDSPKGRKRSRKDEKGNVLYETVESPGEVMGDDTMPTVYVCANDDLMRLWPRFRHVIQDLDPMSGGA